MKFKKIEENSKSIHDKEEHMKSNKGTKTKKFTY